MFVDIFFVKNINGDEYTTTFSTYIWGKYASHGVNKNPMSQFMTHIIFSVYRYYYDKDILAKIQGKRYAYCFNFHALSLACQAQQTPTPSDAKISDLTHILAPLLNQRDPQQGGSQCGSQDPLSPSSPQSSTTRYDFTKCQ